MRAYSVLAGLAAVTLATAVLGAGTGDFPPAPGEVVEGSPVDGAAPEEMG